MNDLISRQAAIDAIEHANGAVYWNQTLMENLVSVVKSVPTIDAVPVVRCKDCEYYTEDERWCRRLGLCGAFDPDDYCSHSERSEDAAN